MEDIRKDVEIIKEKVKKAIFSVDNKALALKKLTDELLESQRLFYEWDKIDIGAKSYMGSDEVVLKAMTTSFGEGILKAFVKRFVPEMKENLKKQIDKQIDIISKVNG